MSNNKIAPSILAADYANFASELKRIEETVLSMCTSILWMANLYLTLLLVQML